jgi:hypothetical protein
MITKIIRQIFSRKGGNAEVATRQEMLRHTEFFQFGRQVFDKNSSPHELHWALRDAILDNGAKIDAESEPSPSSHWAMTPSNMVGENVGCEADYMPFAGSLRASKGKSVSSKFWMLVLISCLLIPAFGLGLVMLLGCSFYYNWVKRYHNGTILARYDGVYRRPASGAITSSGVKNWEFQVDIMVSYRVNVPPFGIKAMGPDVVQPSYLGMLERTLMYAKSGVTMNRHQPQLVTQFASDYEVRFPVVAGNPPGYRVVSVDDLAGAEMLSHNETGMDQLS